MGNVRLFYSLRQMRPRVFSSYWQRSLLRLCPRQFALRRHVPQAICSFFVLASASAWAQCPPQPAYPPAPPGSQATALTPPETTLHQDLRSSAAAHRDDKCPDHRPMQRRPLSKEDLQELRRVVREHARSNAMHEAGNNRRD